MRAINDVINCRSCPFMNNDTDNGSSCNIDEEQPKSMWRWIDDSNVIPEWCPLKIEAVVVILKDIVSK
jgi:hypothetical protein